MAKADDETTYLLVMKDSTKRKVKVPTKWRVTFGAMFPGSKGAPPGGGVALRFYDGTQQKACFNDVESFRDMNIVLEEEVVHTRQETYRKEGDGEGEAIVAEVHVKEWRNPDKPEATKATAGEPGKLIKLVKQG